MQRDELSWKTGMSLVESSTKPIPVAVFGGKGGAETVATYFENDGGCTEIIGFLNDVMQQGEKIGDYQVIGCFEDWANLPSEIQFNAPLHAPKGIQARLQRILGLSVPHERWRTAVHVMSEISSTARIGKGSSVGAFADVQPGVSIGSHVAIRGSAYVAHDAEVGDFSYIGGQSHVSGYCHLGRGVHIGPGSTIRDRIKIGDYAVVGVGSVVVRDVADYEIVAGNPARRIGWVKALEG